MKTLSVWDFNRENYNVLIGTAKELYDIIVHNESSKFDYELMEEIMFLLDLRDQVVADNNWYIENVLGL